MIRLRHETPARWTDIVKANLVAFLQDHAANERKVAGSALTLLAQHPDRPELVQAMLALAREELAHFEQVYRLLRERGAPLGQDVPDVYMGRLRRAVKSPDVDAYLLDRLVLFAIVEARGHERFALLAGGLADPDLRRFYAELTRAEARHQTVYLELARRYFTADRVDARLEALLEVEAEVAAEMPLRPALH